MNVFPPKLPDQQFSDPIFPNYGKNSFTSGPLGFWTWKISICSGSFWGFGIFFWGRSSKAKDSHTKPQLFFSVSDLVSGAFFFYFKLGHLFWKKCVQSNSSYNRAIIYVIDKAALGEVGKQKRGCARNRLQCRQSCQNKHSTNSRICSGSCLKPVLLELNSSIVTRDISRTRSFTNLAL